MAVDWIQLDSRTWNDDGAVNVLVIDNDSLYARRAKVVFTPNVSSGLSPVEIPVYQEGAVVGTVSLYMNVTALSGGEYEFSLDIVGNNDGLIDNVSVTFENFSGKFDDETSFTMGVPIEINMSGTSIYTIGGTFEMPYSGVSLEIHAQSSYEGTEGETTVIFYNI